MSWFSSLKKSKQENIPELKDVLVQAPPPAKPRGRAKAKDDQVDPALPEKKRARRRLVGAIVMTLTLVVVLPMVLDAEPQPTSQEVAIHVHSKNKLTKSTQAAAVETVAASENVKAAPKASVPSNGKEKSAEPTQEKPASKVKEPTVTKTAVVKTAAKPAAKPASGKVMIQVAALSSEDNVKELRVRLAIAGFKSVTQKVKTAGGERVRVRVGPYASKKDAERYCPKLSKMKLQCSLVAY